MWSGHTWRIFFLYSASYSRWKSALSSSFMRVIPLVLHLFILSFLTSFVQSSATALFSNSTSAPTKGARALSNALSEYKLFAQSACGTASQSRSLTSYLVGTGRKNDISTGDGVTLRGTPPCTRICLLGLNDCIYA